MTHSQRPRPEGSDRACGRGVRQRILTTSHEAPPPNLHVPTGAATTATATATADLAAVKTAPTVEQAES
jgi:hypothetical protein